VCVDAPDYFRKKTAMNAVRIGDELVRYAAVSEEAPWRLLDCQRGAWGTEAAAHRAGTAVARLMDHDYKVFLTDAALGQEVARTIARFCNETGARQLSFDGLEGNWSTGMGQYGRTLFTTSWYEALDRENRGRIINDASNPGHFNWHIYTRMNWGEPWYAGFRESQTLYRFKNQVYYERNLMPRMLGWFALRPDTSLEDAEWLLARAAGFNSGFALAASLASTAQLEADPSSADAARQFGALPAILEAVKQWETARMADAFPPDVRDRMRDNAREFHLEPVSPSRWTLFEVYIQRAAQEGASSSAAELEFNNPYGDQRLQWTVRNVGKQPASGLFVQVDRKKVVDLLNETIPAGGSLRYTGANEATVCDSAWRELARVQVDVQAAVVANGRQKIVFGCRPSPEASLRMEARTLGPGRSVEARQAETGANR
jgi:hypothetical protein